MTITSTIKNWLNKGLALLNLRVETRTTELVEARRLSNLEQNGHFREPIFPTLPQFTRCDSLSLLQVLGSYRAHVSQFARSAQDGIYSFSNDYFSSPDAEIAYAITRLLRPKRIVEVGSGNSTYLFRQAITDGGLATKLVSIDPSPRRQVETVADYVIRQKLEQVPSSELQDVLRNNDILFIDSSHEIRPGNDVVRLFLNIIPQLRKGVVVHIHDIFLPFEYPREWIVKNQLNVQWCEQYLIQALLQGSDEFEVLWPGHFLQRTLPGFSGYFHHDPPGIATSLWLRKLA